MCQVAEYSPSKTTPQQACVAKHINLKEIAYLLLDTIYSSKLTVFLELHAHKISEQIMSTNKHPSIFLYQMGVQCN